MVRSWRGLLLLIGTGVLATQNPPPGELRRVFPRSSADPALGRRLGIEALRREDASTYEPLWRLAARAGPMAVPELAEAMNGASELWRELVCIAALGQTRAEDATRRLFERFGKGQIARPERAVFAALALRSCPPDDKVREGLLGAARSAKAAVRIAALLALDAWTPGRVEKVEPPLRPRDAGVAAAELLASGRLLTPRRLQELLSEWRPGGSGADSIRFLALCVVVAERREGALRKPLRELFGALRGEDRIAAAFALACLEEADAPDQALLGHADDRVAAAYLAGFAAPGSAAFQAALPADAGPSRAAEFRSAYRAARARGAAMADAVALWRGLGREPDAQQLVGLLLARRILAGERLELPGAWEELSGLRAGAWVAAAAGRREVAALVEERASRDAEAWWQWKALRGDLTSAALAAALTERIEPLTVEGPGFLRALRQRLVLDLLAQGSDWLRERRQIQINAPYLPDGLPQAAFDFYRVLERYLKQ